jgi:hypothetical protein
MRIRTETIALLMAASLGGCETHSPALGSLPLTYYSPTPLRHEEVQAKIANRIGVPLANVASELTVLEFRCTSASRDADGIPSIGCSRYNQGRAFTTRSASDFLNVELVATRESDLLKTFRVFASGTAIYAHNP